VALKGGTMSDLISIGRFAQITRLTIKALHIYDAIGLLRPVIVDADSGYRYYRITQLPLARRIRLLRSIDMPLEAIHAVLHAPTPAAMDALLHEHQQRIAARITKDQQALRLLQQLIDHQAEDLAFSVQVKQLPAHLIASIRVQATPADESRMIPTLIDELHTSTTRLGVRCHDEPPVRISHEYTEEMVDTEIAVPITQLVADAGRMTSRILEGGPVAYVMHVGPHADLWAVYWAILVWVQEHGYEQNGPPREVYWMHPADGDAAAYRTEVQWPIRLVHPHEPPVPGTDYANT
jgi:DNA-binding transcriptional MerR regulator